MSIFSSWIPKKSGDSIVNDKGETPNQGYVWSLAPHESSVERLHFIRQY